MALLTKLARCAAALATLAVTLLGVAGDVRAETATSSRLEFQVKAAFLYNFAKFVEWPPGALGSSGDALRVCVWSEDPFEGQIEALVADKTVVGRRLEVRHPAKAVEIAACHLLYVPASEDPRVGDLLCELGQLPVLTVGETERFQRAGGIVRFVVDEGKVRFEIDQDAASRTGLKISSKLLAVARTVSGGAKPE